MKSDLAHATRIGVIGQGFVGYNLANHLRRKPVVRYALDPIYKGGKDEIPKCAIVFICVPTPTTPAGFDTSALEEALSILSAGTIAVIKSTVLPGITRAMQDKFPTLTIMHAPEFLREASADTDTAFPERNIIGLTDVNDKELQKKAREILAILPRAKKDFIVTTEEAELAKYGSNLFLYLKVVFANILNEATDTVSAPRGSGNAGYRRLSQLIAADPRIGGSHLAVYDSGGRGAGGHCFIKDFAAFCDFYEKNAQRDTWGAAFLRAAESKNKQLLRSSSKDIDILESVYGVD